VISVTKFIRIGIADKNDNPPFFDKALYEAEVDENEDIQHTVLTVTAKDLDECEYYLLTSMPSSGCEMRKQTRTLRPPLTPLQAGKSLITLHRGELFSIFIPSALGCIN